MRILTWNVNGDSGTYASDKVNKLNDVIQYWDDATRKDEVAIICLQELSVNSCICQYLYDNGWDVQVMREQPGERGDLMAIAVRRDFFEFQGKAIMLDLEKYADKSIIPSTPSRCPMYVTVKDRRTCDEIMVFTWHATLGSCQNDHFVTFSKILDTRIAVFDAEICRMKVVIAADMNNDMSDVEYYGDFEGVSHNIDHILGRNIAINDGYHMESVYSDHSLLSAHFDYN